MKTEPGDKIIIKVDGEEYETYIDDQGVQRFPEGPARVLRDINLLDLNKLAIMAAEGKINKKDYMKLNMDLGYSVCGFVDLMSGYEDNTDKETIIENPVWE